MTALFQAGLGKVDGLVDRFVSTGYQALADYMAPALHAGMTLYVVVTFASSLRSHHMSLPDIAHKLMRAGFVYLLALQWGTFSTWIYHTVTAGPREIATLLISAMGTGASDDPRAVLDAAYTQISDGITLLFAQGSITAPAAWFAAVLVFIGAVFFFGPAFFILIAAKLGLGLILVLAPLFIAFALFPTTRDIFGAWVRSVLAFSFIPLVVGAAVAFGIFLLDDAIQIIKTGEASLGDACVFLLLGMGAGLTLLMSHGIASGLAGSPVHGPVGSMAALGTAPVLMTARYLRQRVAQHRAEARRRQNAPPLQPAGRRP